MPSRQQARALLERAYFKNDDPFVCNLGQNGKLLVENRYQDEWRHVRVIGVLSMKEQSAAPLRVIVLVAAQGRRLTRTPVKCSIVNIVHTRMQMR